LAAWRFGLLMPSRNASPAGASRARRGAAGRPGPDTPRGLVKARRPSRAAWAPQTEALRLASDQCNAAFAYQTSEGGDVNDLEELLCLVDCAQLCAVTEAMVARGSEHANELRALCAELCKCVEESSAEYGDDQVMSSCAEACRAAYDSLSAQAAPKVG
jgi:hypothetical protein